MNGKDKPPYLNAEGGGDLVKNGKVVARTFTSALGHEIYISDGAATDKQFVRINTSKREATVFIGADKIDVIGKKIPLEGVQRARGRSRSLPMVTSSSRVPTSSSKSTQDITIDAGANLNLKAKAEYCGRRAGQRSTSRRARPPRSSRRRSPTVKGSMVKIN